MKTRLAANGYRFNALVEGIVTSPQFLNKRSTEPREKPDTALKPDALQKPTPQKKGE
jgi:hypothetical protein